MAENCEGASYERRDGACMVSIPFPHPLFNSVLTAEIPQGGEDQAIRSARRFFEERSMPWNWIVGPITEPWDLARHLLGAGFTHSHNTPGMARDLRGHDIVSTPEVAEVTDELSFAAWLGALTLAFGMPEEAGRPFLALQQRLGFSHAPVRYFVAMDGSRPVATAMNYNGAGVAGIYCVGTVPDARRRGYGERVMQACLAAAVEDGYDAAILHSSRMGVPLYQKLGFKEYCKLAYYRPPVEPSVVV